MPRPEIWAVALLAAGCPAPAPDPDPDSDTGSDPDTAGTDPDTTDPDMTHPDDCPEIPSNPLGSAEPIACDDPAPELVPVSFELIDPCRRCVVGGRTEHLPAEDWYTWWYTGFCSEQGCLDNVGYAVDTAGRCLFFNSICAGGAVAMPSGLVGQCSWAGADGLPELGPDDPCCAAAASERYLPPCPEPE